VLGVDDVAAVADRLNDARKKRRDADAALKGAATRLVLRLSDVDDQRAVAASEALQRRPRPDLDTLDGLATGEADGEADSDELGQLHELAALTGPDLNRVDALAAEVRAAAA